MKLLKFNKKPTAVIWLIATFLFVIHFLKILAIIGTPYIVAQILKTGDVVTFSEIKGGFTRFFEEISSRTGMNLLAVKYFAIYSGIRSFLFVVIAPFLGLRKNFARFAILGLIVIDLLVITSLGIGYRFIPSLETYLFNFLFLIALINPDVSKNFQEVQ